MATLAWPGTVPTSPLLSGLNQSYEGFNASFQPDVGLPNTWPRSTGAQVTIPFSFYVTAAEKTALLTFWKDTTKMGSLPFVINDFESGSNVTAKFNGGLSFNATGATTKPWVAQFQLIRFV